MRLQILNDKSGPIALWAFWVLCVLGAVVFWLVVASQASAQVGTVVGKEATLFWTETDTSGCPQLGFKQYDQGTPTPLPIPGTTPPTTTLAPPAAGNAPTQLFLGVANAGQHYSSLTAYCPATGAESVLAPQVPWFLTLAPPAAIPTLTVSAVAGVCTVSWAKPTLNGDGTALIGGATQPQFAPLSYLVYASSIVTPPVPGTTVPALTLAAPTGGPDAPPSFACSRLPAGQQQVWVAAQNVNGIGGVQASPLVFGAAPSTPAGVTIR